MVQNRKAPWCKPPKPRNLCTLYEATRKIPAYHFNNPHVCDIPKKFPPEEPKQRLPRRNVPRYSKQLKAPASEKSEARMMVQEELFKRLGQSPALDKAKIREARMMLQQELSKRLRQLKYPSTISLAPEQGRQNVNLQTDEFLEAIYDNPPTATTCTQTTGTEPVTPVFIPAKTGVDTCTQIYPDDLFFFDEEVRPILEVTTGNTIEQALMEVLHEDEIDGMERERRRFMNEKCAEEAEVQRLEEEERRKRTEMEERIAELEKAKEKQEDLKQRLAAAMLSERVCKELVPDVLEQMTADGFYVDDAERDVLCVRDEVMKNVENDVCEELKNTAESEDILGRVIREVVQDRYDAYTELGENPRQRFIYEAPEAEENEGEEVEPENFDFTLMD